MIVLSLESSSKWWAFCMFCFHTHEWWLPLHICLTMFLCLPSPPLGNPFLLANCACLAISRLKLDQFGLYQHQPQVCWALGQNGHMLQSLPFLLVLLQQWPLIVATSFRFFAMICVPFAEPSSLSFLDMLFNLCKLLRLCEIWKQLMISTVCPQFFEVLLKF